MRRRPRGAAGSPGHFYRLNLQRGLALCFRIPEQIAAFWPRGFSSAVSAREGASGRGAAAPPMPPLLLSVPCEHQRRCAHFRLHSARTAGPSRPSRSRASPASSPPRCCVSTGTRRRARLRTRGRDDRERARRDPALSARRLSRVARCDRRIRRRRSGADRARCRRGRSDHARGTDVRGPGDTVRVLDEPTYPLLRISAWLAGAEVVDDESPRSRSRAGLTTPRARCRCSRRRDRSSSTRRTTSAAARPRSGSTVSS